MGHEILVPSQRNDLSPGGALPELVAQWHIHVDSWQRSAPNSTQSFVAIYVCAVKCLRSPDVCVLPWGGRNHSQICQFAQILAGKAIAAYGFCM